MLAQLISHISDKAPLHHTIDPIAHLNARDPFNLGDKLQILAHRHLGIERRVLWEIADPLTNLIGLGDNIKPSYRSFTR
jgi:hypothetical protein